MTTDIVPSKAPMTSRDVWLTVALAVAKGQIAHPDDFEVRNNIKDVSLLYNAKTGNPLAIKQATAAAAFLGLRYPSKQPGIHTWWEIAADGWCWNVRAYFDGDEPTSALAEQVANAIEAGTDGR